MASKMDSNVYLNPALPLAELMTGGVGKKPQLIQTFIRRPRERRSRGVEAQHTGKLPRLGRAVRPVGTLFQETLPGEPTDPRSKATVCTYEVTGHQLGMQPGEVVEVIRCVKREKVKGEGYATDQKGREDQKRDGETVRQEKG